MVDPETLERIPLFAALNAPARRELARRAARVAFAPGEVLWRAGGAPRGLLVVLEGEVRVVRAADGRQRVVHTEGPGGTLGEVPLFSGGAYPATAVAARRTLCLALDRDALGAAVREDPELAFALLGRLAGRVRHLVERLDRVAGRSVPARLAAFLLARAEGRGAAPFTLGRTQAETAEELGTVREVLVRALGRLRREGLVERAGRGGLRIVDEAGLRRLAEGG